MRCALDIAKYILCIAQENGDLITNLKLQKLLYYAQDGDFTTFYRAIERVVKARTSVSELARKLKMDRSNLSEILNGKKEPKMQTVFKILGALGYELTLSQKVS